ncbi:phosphomannomutase/phosphoglucomutase [Candidatus Peregrinibacteria bacterium]|nr:phosphomannomutase/phosphoglucomutase [Candidatus Peregrinibacteria bacterium]MBT4631744.1 phosphomannomutase/phosphoglucomutase [Candidatus Peregrinibacteria bacterium]MBT5517246.1 phosphomannomutase/phosphoglucomutase [Candidatus Peregrinibacteria bacterium]MBT5824531.1 phosphomannomutase/phosphoglucomutase [Candidatus Peregrinibacteria bacterium]
MNSLIFRAYDIRGIAHKPESDKTPDLTPETIELIGKASGTYIKRKFGPKIALAYDCRLSTPELREAFIKGMISTGCQITDIGMVPTPIMYFAVCKFNFDGGVCITASHNPKEYNGVKLVGKDAHSICGDDLQDVLAIIQNEDYETGEGSLEELKIFPAYLGHILDMIKIDKPLKIVVDAANGAAGPYIKPFFEALGCEVIALYEEPDGSFPNHEANPEKTANMQDLAAAVKENSADLGFGFDGDGDRVGLVDENGKHYNADLLLLLLTRDLLTRKPGAKIVFDVKVSQVLIDDIKKHGGEPVMSKTGHSFIEKKMHELHAPLGGEISGHMFIAENYYGFDDAMLAAAKLLKIAAAHEGPFSTLFDDVAKTASTQEIKSPCPDTEKFAIVEKITANFTSKYDCITIDGVRVNFDNESWAAVRSSNTSPNLTIRFEAPNQERLKEIMQIMLSELEKYPEIDLWWKDKAPQEL